MPTLARRGVCLAMEAESIAPIKRVGGVGVRCLNNATGVAGAPAKWGGLRRFFVTLTCIFVRMRGEVRNLLLRFAGASASRNYEMDDSCRKLVKMVRLRRLRL